MGPDSARYRINIHLISKTLTLKSTFWLLKMKNLYMIAVSQQLKRASFGSAWSSSPMHCMVLLPVSICAAIQGNQAALGGGCSMSTSSGWQLEGRVLGGGVGSPDTDLPEGL